MELKNYSRHDRTFHFYKQFDNLLFFLINMWRFVLKEENEGGVEDEVSVFILDKKETSYVTESLFPPRQISWC